MSKEVEKLEENQKKKLTENIDLKQKLLENQKNITKKSKEWEMIKNTNMMLDTENTIKKEDLKPKDRKFLVLKQKETSKISDLIEINHLPDDDHDDFSRINNMIKNYNLTISDIKTKRKCSIF